MIPGGTSRRGFFVGGLLMNKHALVNKHTKIDLPSRRIQDERQLFATQIRAGRAVLGWSQSDLGERIGVTQRAIYRIEDGATRPRQSTRLRIRKSLRRRRRGIQEIADRRFHNVCSLRGRWPNPGSSKTISASPGGEITPRITSAASAKVSLAKCA